MELLQSHLQRFGYGEIPSQVIDWSFKLDTTKDFMDWLSESLSGCDALTTEESELSSYLT